MQAGPGAWALGRRRQAAGAGGLAAHAYGRWARGARRRQAASAGGTGVRALGGLGTGGSGASSKALQGTAARGKARQARGLGAERPACARGLGQLGARAPGLVSNLVFLLGIFPKSLNEHGSL